MKLELSYFTPWLKLFYNFSLKTQSNLCSKSNYYIKISRSKNLKIPPPASLKKYHSDPKLKRCTRQNCTMKMNAILPSHRQPLLKLIFDILRSPPFLETASATRSPNGIPGYMDTTTTDVPVKKSPLDCRWRTAVGFLKKYHADRMQIVVSTTSIRFFIPYTLRAS